MPAHAIRTPAPTMRTAAPNEVILPPAAPAAVPAAVSPAAVVASPAPADGMRVFYYLLRRLGISDADLHAMIVTNPARLLDLEPLTEEV